MQEDPSIFDASLYPGELYDVLSLLSTNWSRIRTHKHIGKKLDKFNFRFETGYPNEIEKYLLITYGMCYNKLKKFNVAFSYLLMNRKTKKFRFYYASNNSMYFPVSIPINTKFSFIKKIIDPFLSDDYVKILREAVSPNSKWIFYRLIAMTIFCWKLEH